MCINYYKLQIIPERNLCNDLTKKINSYNNIFRYKMRELSAQSNMVNSCNRDLISMLTNFTF